MSTKRKDGSADSRPDGSYTKRQRVHSSTTLQKPTQQQNNAGPSLTKVSFLDSLTGLPSTLDVERFAETSSDEIQAMQSDLDSRTGASNHRVWQSLPRALRRRAASHDVLRVPQRLGGRAKAEPSTLGSERRLRPTEKFALRQRNKTWLETHIWHAKRMHMETKWGYRLAITPTEKSWRPSHRASVHGSILHDASYFATIELKGRQKVLCDILNMSCDVQGRAAGAQQYIAGSRIVETHIYESGAYPIVLIAPATILWRPLPPRRSLVADSDSSEVEEGMAEPAVSKMSRRTKKLARSSGDPMDSTTDFEVVPSPGTHRTVWIRVHPGAYDTTLSSLQDSASHVLNAAKRVNPIFDLSVELADLRDQVVAFELMGPKASQVIKGALTPIVQDQRNDFVKFWSGIGEVRTSGSIPRGMIVSCTTYDPRLKHKHKNSKISDWDPEAPPSATPSVSNLTPGTSLQPTEHDARIPILVIQRSIEAPAPSDTPHVHGWTILAPAGWSQHLVMSLIHTGTSVDGLRERAQVISTLGLPCFPSDYPATALYSKEQGEEEDEERERWRRTPAAKKPNIESLGVRSQWRADWDVVLGLAETSVALGLEDELVDTQRVSRVPEVPSFDPWLLRGPDTLAIITQAASNYLDTATGLLSEVDLLRSKRGLATIQYVDGAKRLLKTALVGVRVVPIARGSPERMSIIYQLSDKEVEENDVDSASPITHIMGYVSSGGFSMAEGAARGRGTISLAALLELMHQMWRLKATDIFAGIRNRNGLVGRVVKLEVDIA